MRAIVPVLALALVATGCDSAQDALQDQLGTTVEDLRGQADQLLQQGRDLAATFQWCTSAAQLAQAATARDVDAVRAAAAELQGTAPEELRPDLDLIVQAAEAAADGDRQALLADDVQQAARDVYAFAAERCGLADGEG